jgi:hypothetical protein
MLLLLKDLLLLRADIPLIDSPEIMEQQEAVLMPEIVKRVLADQSRTEVRANSTQDFQILPLLHMEER